MIVNYWIPILILLLLLLLFALLFYFKQPRSLIAAIASAVATVLLALIAWEDLSYRMTHSSSSAKRSSYSVKRSSTLSILKLSWLAGILNLGLKQIRKWHS